MNGHGGRRPGSGRKKLTDKHRAAIEAVEAECASRAKSAFNRLWDLIDPVEVVERRYEPAALLTRKGLATDADGVIVRDDKGKPSPVDVQRFPGKEPDELVLVEEKRIVPQPDVRAIKELFDRLMGKAPQSIDLNNGDDGPLKIQVVYANARPAGGAALPAPGPVEGPGRDQPV